MQDADILTDQLVAALQDNAAFVALMGGDQTVIRAHHHEHPFRTQFSLEVAELVPPGALLAYRSFRSSDRSGRLEHTFSLVLRPKAKIGPVLQALRNGVIAATGQKFYQHQPNNDVHPPDIIGGDFRAEFIGENQFIEYFEATIRVTERGTDN